jgi:hypothetical protein
VYLVSYRPLQGDATAIGIAEVQGPKPEGCGAGRAARDAPSLQFAIGTVNIGAAVIKGRFEAVLIVSWAVGGPLAFVILGIEHDDGVAGPQSAEVKQLFAGLDSIGWGPCFDLKAQEIAIETNGGGHIPHAHQRGYVFDLNGRHVCLLYELK